MATKSTRRSRDTRSADARSPARVGSDAEAAGTRATGALPTASAARGTAATTAGRRAARRKPLAPRGPSHDELVLGLWRVLLLDQLFERRLRLEERLAEAEVRRVRRAGVLSDARLVHDWVCRFIDRMIDEWKDSEWKTQLGRNAESATGAPR